MSEKLKYKFDPNNKEGAVLYRVEGILHETVGIEEGKMNPPINPTSWLYVKQENGKICEAIIGTEEGLKYCLEHKAQMVKGKRVKLKGVCFIREKKDYMLIHDGVGVELLKDELNH